MSTDERLTPRAFGEPWQLLALDETSTERTFAPTAFSLLELLGMDTPETTVTDGVAVVRVDGPLDTRGSWCWDGYDTVEGRVREAFAQDDVRAVVLAFLDAPGGMANGMLDGARALRRVADEAGKPMVAHVGTMACSAAYGLAVACDAIVTTEDGEVGSVGVLCKVFDRTAQNEKQGLNVRVVRSGTLKADPHPDIALTDASVARVRARVMELAVMFGGYVAGRRPQCGDVLAHQGAAFMGQSAVDKGFADRVGTLADAITHARQLADAQENENAMNVDKNNPAGAAATATLTQLRGAVGATTDDELVARITALVGMEKRHAEVAAELAQLKSEQAREKAEAEKRARADLIDQAKADGKLTKALLDDAEYMATLDSLTFKQLQTTLRAMRPAVPTAELAPRKVPSLDPDATPEAEVSAEEIDFAAKHGVKADELKKVAERDAKERRARSGR